MNVNIQWSVLYNFVKIYIKFWSIEKYLGNF